MNPLVDFDSDAFNDEFGGDVSCVGVAGAV
jgi:hypothetical protein